MYTPPANNIILDTNIWLYLANGFDQQSNSYIDGGYHFELLASLKKMHDASEICVLVNDVILTEWERNKNATQNLINRLKNKIEELENAHIIHKKFMTTEDIMLQEQINQRIKANYLREIEKNEEHKRKVESFLKNECKQIPISDTVKLKVWDLAMKKVAPFHRNKNNFADATLLLSAVEYISSSENKNWNSFFISNNTEDFCENKSSTDFHPEIQILLSNIDLQFEKRLDKGLQVSEEIQQELNEFYKEKYYESIVFNCRMGSCLSNNEYQPFGYLDTPAVVLQERQMEKDPNQLHLFLLDDIPKKNQISHLGSCLRCGSTHIECPVCDELVSDIMIGYDFECAYCHTEFSLGYSFDDGTLELLIRDQSNRDIIGVYPN